MFESSNLAENGYKYSVLDEEVQETTVVTNNGSVNEARLTIKEQDDKNIWWYKCLRTCSLTLALSALGFDGCIISPTIPDMRERLHISMEEYARSSMSMSVGAMLGSVIGGIICDRFHKYSDAIVAFSLSIMGTSLILRPWSPSLFILCLNTFIDGIAGGSINAVTSAIHFNVWGAKPMPMYIKNLGWTAACPLVPLIAKDFLSNVNNEPLNTFMNSSGLNGTNFTATHPSLVSNQTMQWWQHGQHSRIEIPFAICGFIAYSIIPLFCYFQYKRSPLPENKQRATKSSWKEVFSPGSCAGGATCFSISMIISLMTFYVFIVASNTAMWDLTFSYVVDPRTEIQFTKDEASYMQTAQTSVYLLCRILTIFVSPFIPIQALLGGTIFASFLGTIFFVLYGLHNKSALWGSLLFVSFVQSPTWAAGLLWAEHYIHVYAILVGFTDIGSGTASLIMAWVNGKLFDSERPENIYYLGLGFWVLFCLHFIIVQTNASCHVRKHGHFKRLQAVVDVDPDMENLLSDDENECEELELVTDNT